jgi:hypothetical protein
MSTRFSLAAMRMAYHIGDLDHVHQEEALRDIIHSAHPFCLQSTVEFIEEVRAVLNDDAWKKALRTMRRYRWSSY